MEKKKKKKDKETYKLTPKGIAIIALIEAGFTDSNEDVRIDDFWKIFERDIIKSGYVK